MDKLETICAIISGVIGALLSVIGVWVCVVASVNLFAGGCWFQGIIFALFIPVFVIVGMDKVHGVIQLIEELEADLNA